MEFKRKHKKIPDAINCSHGKNYTSISNEFLRNPEISAKAKGILCLLLSNKKGWTSYLETIIKMMKDKKPSIETGIKELEENFYLLRIKYRNKKTKQYVGSFWAYTDVPKQFDISETLNTVEMKGFEVVIPHSKNPHSKNPDVENPDMALPGLENQLLKRLIGKKTKDKKTNGFLLGKNEDENSNGNFIKRTFQIFWRRYPNKVEKLAAFKKWETLFKSKKLPNLQIILDAINKGIEWRKNAPEGYFTPDWKHPTTWLNKGCWDDEFDFEYKKSSNYKPINKQQANFKPQSDGKPYPVDYGE